MHRFNKLGPALLALTVISILTIGHLHVFIDYGEEHGATICHGPPSYEGMEQDDAGTRYARSYVEEFNNYTKIDYTNTTAIVNTFSGRAYLSGFGSNPRSDIRDVSNPDRTKGYNRFTCRAVAVDGKFYIRDRYQSNTIHVYATLHDFMNNGNRIDSFNLPFNPNNYCQMIYVNGHLFFSNAGNVDKFRLADRTKVQCSLSGAGATSWGWGGGSQCGLTTDGQYIYTYSSTTVRVYDMNENLLRQVNIPEQQRSMGTCFSAGHYFYPVGYSRGNMNHRLDGDSGNVENYNDVCMNGFDYLTCFNYDYFGNSLVMTNGNAGNRPDTTWTVDNLCYNFGGEGGHDMISFIQSKPIYQELPTIGAARMTWYQHKPSGTDVVYNMTVDGENWITMENGTTHVFEDRGSCLLWNATLTTDSEDYSPYIDRVVIEYDLFSSPQPHLPDSTPWQGTPRPRLEWNFTDPDQGDQQSDFHIEIYDSPDMGWLVYDSDWINSTDAEHDIAEDLPDGQYHWRVRTKDIYLVVSNFSALKQFKIDVTKPTGSIVIEEGAPSVNEKLIDLCINASDNGSGVVDMRIINDRGTVEPWEVYQYHKRIVLDESDGMKVIGVQFRDNASIISNVFNDSVYLDLKGPRDIRVTSSTHPDPTLHYNNTDPLFQWEPPFEVTEIKGYSYMIDTSQHTEPGKVLYNPGPDQVSTLPGEFSGLNDGAWYFHITPCDIYDQWGNTSHFRFNIDTAGPVAMSLEPESDMWFKVTSVKVSAVFRDSDGSGMDITSVRYTLAGDDGSFGPWMDDRSDVDVLEDDGSGTPVKIVVALDAELVEGTTSLRWRCGDLAGNMLVNTAETVIKADFTPVSFSDPFPAPDELFQDASVICGITLSDHGSGVSGKSIEYCISCYGDELSLFRNWTVLGNSMVRNEIEAAVKMEFPPGTDNYIMWRAKDVVGNGYSFSEPVLIRINSEPVPEMASPGKNAIFSEGKPVEMSANGSLDPDGDTLTFYWEVKNRTTKSVVFRGWGRDTAATLSEGDYDVTLWVDDSNGGNVSIKNRMWVGPGEGDGGGGSDGDGGDGGDGGGMGGGDTFLGDSGGFSFLIVGIICAVLFFIVILTVLLLVRRKSKKKEQDITSPPVPPESHPYPWGGYRPGIHGGYSAQQQHRTGPPQYGPPGTAPYPQQGVSSPFNAVSNPAMSMQAQPASGIGPRRPPGLPPVPTPLRYALPPMTTADGPQDLNLLALPPAPETSTADATSTLGQLPMNHPQMNLWVSSSETQESASPSPPPPNGGGPRRGFLRMDGLPPPPDLSPTMDSPETSPATYPNDAVPGPACQLPAEVPLQDGADHAGPAFDEHKPVEVPPQDGAVVQDEAQMRFPGLDAPVPEVPADAAPQELTMQCHACGGNYTAVVESYPAIVQCPVCGTRGMLNG